jgi:hypothetical protein
MNREWKENALAHAGVLEVACDEAGERQRRAEACHRRHERREVARAQKGSPPRREDALLVDRPRGGEEAVERGVVTRGEARDLGTQAFAVAREVEVALVVRPADPVERVEPPQRELAVEVESAGGERLLENPRHGQDRGPVSHVSPASRSW